MITQLSKELLAKLLSNYALVTDASASALMRASFSAAQRGR